MKLSNLVLIFAAVTEARKVGVGSRWEKKQGLYVILHRLWTVILTILLSIAAKQEKSETKAENKQAA